MSITLLAKQISLIVSCCEKEVEVNSEMINLLALMPMLPFSFASKATVKCTSIIQDYYKYDTIRVIVILFIITDNNIIS